MIGQKDPWFVVERSKALVNLLLTSRPDLKIRGEHETDFGLDLMVELTDGSLRSSRPFVVQVKGTADFAAADWREDIKELFKIHPDSPYYIPTCVFVTDVRSNQSYYAWIAEPRLVSNGVGLKFLQPEHFDPLDSAALEQIVGLIRTWYDAVPRQIIAN